MIEVELAEEIQQKKKLNVEAANTKTEIVIDKVDSALALIDEVETSFTSQLLPGSSVTGFGGATLSNIPGTAAFNLEKTVDTIKANLGFQELTNMRASSPTGGALGQVSERELGFLQSVVASLELGQDSEQLVSNLKKVKQHMLNWKKAVEDDFNSSKPSDNNSTDDSTVRRIKLDATGKVVSDTGAQ